MSLDTFTLHPSEVAAVVQWRRKTRSLWAAHNRAERAMGRVMTEAPRRPWHRLRLSRVMAEYERTLNAIPEPPI